MVLSMLKLPKTNSQILLYLYTAKVQSIKEEKGLWTLCTTSAVVKFNGHSEELGTQGQVMVKPCQLLLSRCESH